MEMPTIDFENVRNYFKGQNDDSGYINELFCDFSKENELKNFLKKHWYEFLREDSEEEKDLSHVLYRIHYRINTRKEFHDRKQKISNFLLFFSKIAAILFIPLVIYTGIQLLNVFGSGKKVPLEIKAPAWARVEFTLPDGSRGWLNSGSTISYMAGSKFKREVNLKGEAFFEVSKKKKIFKVYTDDVSISVYGTKFNVAAYDNENTVEVVLEEGSVSFSDKKSGRTYLMRPGEFVEYDKSTGKTHMENVQTYKYTSWKEGKLVFRNDPIDVIARRLERWYNIDVEIEGNLHSDLRLRATFVDEDLEEILEILKRTLKIDYRIVEGTIGKEDVYVKRKVILWKAK